MTAVLLQWTGEEFAPIKRSVQAANDSYVVGELYWMAPVEDRSKKSHDHFFATVSEAWKNLPESLGDRFKNPDHLRRWALIKAGYCDEMTMVCASHAEALRWQPLVERNDESTYAIAIVRGAVVTIHTAKSQSLKAMGSAKDFQASKQAVLDILSEMLGVEPDQLQRARAA